MGVGVGVSSDGVVLMGPVGVVIPPMKESTVQGDESSLTYSG